MAYFVDSNVFIEGANRHFGLDFCPGFWDWLAAAHKASVVYSISRVRDELVGKKDAVSQWASAAPSGFFVKPNGATMTSLTKIAPWLIANYSAADAGEFMARADYYLVAEALARGGTVVTHEVLSNGAKVKIPNVCKAFGVDYCNPFQMLRSQKAKLVLQQLPAIKVLGAPAANPAPQPGGGAGKPAAPRGGQ